MTATPESQPLPRSIRFQLLAAVNLALGAAIVALLVVRYTNEMEDEVGKKHLGLNDEAAAVHAAATHLWEDHHADSVQLYIDTVCDRMRESDSPCHHIVVRLHDRVLQSRSHNHNDADIVAAVEAAAVATDHRSSVNERVIVVGSFADNGVSVFVSENLDNIRRSIRRDVFIQLAVLGLLGLVAAAVVNLVLIRIVTRPMQRLLLTVGQIADGQLGAESTSFGSYELQQLGSAVNLMSRTLKANDSERRQQMKKAREIQQHLLPRGVVIPGLMTADVFEPADVVAGDYYDFLPLSDGSWLICVADVTGHGVPAAMGAAMLKSLLQTATEQAPFDPVSIVDEVNRRFALTVLPGNFASMFLARWEPASRSLCWASAGHEPAILLREDGQLEHLESTGLLLGIDENADWEERSVTLQPGDRILLFSDGATDIRDPEGELFGRDRLIACFTDTARNATANALHSLNSVLDTYRAEQPLLDDLTLVLLECGTTAGTTAVAENRQTTVTTLSP